MMVNCNIINPMGQKGISRGLGNRFAPAKTAPLRRRQLSMEYASPQRRNNARNRNTRVTVSPPV